MNKDTPTFNLEITRGNIAFDQILEFVDYYTKSRSTRIENHFINIEFKDSQVDAEDEKLVQEEIDYTFFSYLILFLDEFNNSRVKIKTSKSDRYHSLLTQVYHLNYLGFYNVEIKGNSEKEVYNSKFPRYTQSRSFIPAIFISKENYGVQEYFEIYSDTSTNPYVNLYWKTILEKCDKYTPRRSSLNYFEIYLLRLLVSDSKNVNRSTFDNLIIYIKKLSSGVKELAENIEHSEFKKGVISVRIYEDERIRRLKSVEITNFLEEKDWNRFLDINIIDFGGNSIRETYKSNLETSINITDIYTEDLAIISDNTRYDYKDFFVYNIESEVEHQKNKLISRFGLQYFTEVIVSQMQGFIKTASDKEGVILFNNLSNKDGHFINEGTNYNCIICADSTFINSKKFRPDHIRLNRKIKQTGVHVDSISNLFKYKLVKLESNTSIVDKVKNGLYQYDHTVEISDKKRENALISYEKITRLNEKLDLDLLVIDHSKLPLSASDWLRLLSQLSLKIADLIIFNIPFQSVREIIDYCKVNAIIKKHSFWNSDSRVLFYSLPSSNEDSFKGAHLLLGPDFKHFVNINTVVSRNHFSCFEELTQGSKKVSDISDFNLDGELFHKGNLKHFELLLYNKDEFGAKSTLFEKFLQNELNKELKYSLSEKPITGYKITNAHFRLGSKIHIRDFFYAKRIFQSSFFTTPLAFLIAQDLIEMIKSSLNGNDPITELSLVGYEVYSNFLISTIRNLIDERKIQIDNNNFRINHFIISSDGVLSKDIESLKKKTLLIVPIAASFSTSIKMQNQLEDHRNLYNLNRGKFISTEFIKPNLNIILVGHKKMGQDNSYKNFEHLTIEAINAENEFKFTDSTLTRFGWNSINKKTKTIQVKSFNNQESFQNKTNNEFIAQNYLIPVYTEWFNVEECKLCFVENASLETESCLIETGKASVTPSLIFDYPKVKESNTRTKKKLDYSYSLLYGNVKRHKNKYLYFTRTGSLVSNELTKNNYNISEWLIELRNKLFGKLMNKRIVIITPAASSKSGFLDLVNKHVFDYSANCISIRLNEDHIENSKTLYEDGLSKADIVVYVDDIICTASSFLSTNYIVKHIRKKITSGKGIDYCISLVNRMSYDNEDNLLLKLTDVVTHNVSLDYTNPKDRFFYYSKINNPAMEDPLGDFPVDKEVRRYEDLSRTSALDTTRKYFRKKQIKIREYDIGISRAGIQLQDYNTASNNKKLFQFFIVDVVYMLFTVNIDGFYKYKNRIEKIFESDNECKDSDNSFELLIDHVTEMLGIPTRSNGFKNVDEVETVYTKHRAIIDFHKTNLKFTILKVLSSPPLVYHKSIRKKVFYWVLKELEQFRLSIEDIEENPLRFFINKDNELYSNFQKFKFLLKKSVQMKSNYIITSQMFDFIFRLIHVIDQNEESINLAALTKNRKSWFKAKNNFKSYTNEKYKDSANILERKQIRQLISKLDSNDDLLQLRKEILKQIKRIDEEDGSFNSELSFDSDLDEFKSQFYSVCEISRFKPLVSSKDLTYHLVALVQELINEHETKAVRLEQNIFEWMIKANAEYGVSFDEITNNRFVGNFYHYLRILRLENTSSIDRFWEYFLAKEKYVLENSNLNLSELESELSRVLKGTLYEYFLPSVLQSSKSPRELQTKLLELIGDDIESRLDINKVFENSQRSELNFADIKGLLIEYTLDPKLDSIKPLFSTDNQCFVDPTHSPFMDFLFIRSKLHNWLANKGKNSLGIASEVQEILEYAAKIIGIGSEVPNRTGITGGAFLTIKYFNKSISSEKEGNFFQFDKYYYKSNSQNLRPINITGVSNNGGTLEDNPDSLTIKMFEGINLKNREDTIISNFEVIKRDDKFEYREGTNLGEKFIEEEAIECQYCNLNNRSNYNILLVKISDFDAEDKLNPQAVLTFFMDKGDRIDPNRLRLLFLLRKTVSEFIKVQFENDSLRAYIDSKITEKRFDQTKHGLDRIEKILEGNFQSGIRESDHKKIEILFKALINKKNLLKQILESGESLMKEDEEVMLLSDIIKKFEENVDLIMRLPKEIDNIAPRENYRFIKTKDLLKNLDKTCTANSRFMDDMIFELARNLRKHLPKEGVQKETLITIDYVIEKDKGYIKFINNAPDTIDYRVKVKTLNLDKRFSLNKGINLISNILLKTKGEHLILDTRKPNEFVIKLRI